MRASSTWSSVNRQSVRGRGWMPRRRGAMPSLEEIFATWTRTDQPELSERHMARVKAMYPDAIIGPTHHDLHVWLDWCAELDGDIPDLVADQIDPRPTLAIGGDRGVVIRFAGAEVQALLPTVVWLHPHVPTSALIRHRTAVASELDDEGLRSFIAACMRDREAQFRPCRICRELVPPEHRHGDVCHGCAERHLGVCH